MSVEQNISNTQIIVAELNDALESGLPPEEVNMEIKKCILNLNSLTKFTGNPKRLLNNIKKMLIESPADSELDFDSILDLLDILISKCSFDDVLDTFSVDDLALSFESGIVPLINSACKVISRSYPKAIFANSELLDIMISLYFDLRTDVAVINNIEKSIRELSSDDLVRKRILENNLPTLISIRKTFDATLLSRLMELLSLELQFINKNEFNESLFSFLPNEILKFLDSDIILFINILVYYTNLLEESTSIKIGESNHGWMLKYVLNVMPTFGTIYAERDKHTDIHYFGRSYLFKFFKSISYLDDASSFRMLDVEYLKISEKDEYLIDFLSFVNPAYLLKYHSLLLKEFVSITPSKLSVLRNIVSNEGCFELIKAGLTSDSVLLLPYMEQMVLLEKLSQYSHSAVYLVHFLPRVMSGLVQNEEKVMEPDCAILRRRTIENLLHFDSNTLDVWYIPLTDALSKIDGPASNRDAQTQIASSFI